MLAASTVPFKAQADEWNKMTVLTIDQPIQVTKTVLEPGTYVFKLLDSPSNRNVVQIFNADQSHIFATILAIPNYRLQPTGDSRFSFYETPAGHPKALHAWFYPGDNYGQEFTYPKQLAMLTTTAAVAAPAPAPMPAPAPEPQAAAPAPPPQEAAAEPQPEPQVEIAQNNPPPPPAVETPAPEPAPAPEPPSLPKTATSYPMFGLGGLLSLGLFGLMRAKREA
jgi:LPXTG-motif cell wall-anchored protein